MLHRGRNGEDGGVEASAEGDPPEGGDSLETEDGGRLTVEIEEGLRERRGGLVV